MDNAPRAAEPLIIRGLSCVHRPFIASSSHETRRTTVNATLRKSESIGNLRNDCNTSGLPNTFDPQRCSVCKCRRVVNDIQTSQLQEQYARQLQQQIYFLELENNYLRQSENKLSTSDEHELKLQNSMHLKPQPNNTLKNYTKEIKQVNIENNTVNPQSADENLENLTSGLNDAKSEYAAAAQTKLLHKFEKAYQKELKETVKESNAENDESLKTAKKPENLANGGLKEKYSRDKTALIEEIVELQQRIDDITPTLALKESQIAMLENEKDAANSQVQSVKDQLQTVQVELVEAKRGEAAASKLELKRNEEIESLRQSLKKFEAEIKEYREKERSFVEDLSDVKRALHEAELMGKKERSIAEKTLEENNNLIKENSQLCTKISLLEMQLEQLKKENDLHKANEVNVTELAEIRDSEKKWKKEASVLQEKLKAEQDQLETTISKLEEWKKTDEEKNQWNLKTKKELEGLQVLSSSLTNENKLLRQEKLALDERCEELERELRKKNDEIKEISERYEATNKEYNKILKELEKETALQHERAGEYEDLVNRVHQLSASLLREEIQPKNIRLKQRSLVTTMDSQGLKNQINNEKKQTEASVIDSAQKLSKASKSK